MENTSGQGKNAVVPSEIARWNWGAFLLNWIWGIGNNTPIALLMFVPFVNLVMPFVLGAEGSSWAWQNKRWENVEHFKAVQRQWAKWGLIILAATPVFFVGIFFGVQLLFKNSEAFQLAVATLEANQEVSQIIGKPITTGFPMGEISIQGPSGKASLSFNASGPDGSGTVSLEATKSLGQWQIDSMVFQQDGTGRRIGIGPGPKFSN